MKPLAAVFRLARWPNLVFIALTQFLFWYFVLPFVFSQNHSGDESLKVTFNVFFVLVLASVCIAAAGNIINDYFDVEIDQVNKPSKVIIGTFIKKKSAILLYAILSTLGLAFSYYAGYVLNNYYIPFFNFLCILFLWLYSAIFKKQLLIGNILVSLLTAWVILVLALAEYRFSNPTEDIVWQQILNVSFIYGGFAFILSLIREIIKDLEDMEGDALFGGRTMPIAWGIRAAKIYAAAWLFILLGLILSVGIYILQFGWWVASLYALVTLVLPLIWVSRALYLSDSSVEYHRLSTAVKAIMLAGIMSMVFFYIPG